MEEAREAAWNQMATTREGSDLGMQPMTKNASAAETAAKNAMMVPAAILLLITAFCMPLSSQTC